MIFRRLYSSQFRKNISTSTAVFGINFLFSLLSFPIYLQYLGYEKYGVWLVLATVINVAQLGDFGVGPAITKLVAESYELRDKKVIERYVTTATYGLIFSGFIILVGILSLRFEIVEIFKLESENASLGVSLLPYVAVLTLYSFVVQVVAGTLSGLNRMDLVSWFQVISRFLALGVAVVLLHWDQGIWSLLIGQFVFKISYHLLCLKMVRQIAPVSFYRIGNVQYASCKKLVQFGSGLVGGRMLGMLVIPLNKLMISRFIGVHGLPIYEISYNVAVNVRGLGTAGLGALTPEVSRLSAMRDKGLNEIKRIFKRVQRMILLFGIPTFLAMFLFANPMLQLWLGTKFDVSLPTILRILLIGAFLDLLATPARFSLLGLGQSGRIFWAGLIRSGFNLLGLVSIVSIFDSISLQAVGWATSGSMVCAAIFLVCQLEGSLKTFRTKVSTSGFE